MKDFVQTRYMFPEHAKVFSISKREWFVAGEIREVLGDLPDEPLKQQELLQGLMEKLRPELKGCVVYCLQYITEKMQWQIGVSHPSLPEIPLGYQPEIEPLIPRSWRDDPSMLGGT